jgi:peptidoglycan/xylan/chitin deacetylase (PgdA/CDA1 family)
MTRRDTILAIAIAIFAAVLIIVAIGTMVTFGVYTGEKARGDEEQVVVPPPHRGPYVPADRVPVLCYHYVRGPGSPLQLARVFGYVVLSLPLLDDSELWKVSRRGFERQMQYLASRGYRTVSLEELHDWQMGRRELPARSVVITFDDGDESVYKYAYPVLKKYGLKATMFVVTGRVGTEWNEVRCLDWPRLRELSRSGVFDIESHTHDLHYKVNSGANARPVFIAASDGTIARSRERWDNAIFDDLMQSRSLIQRHIGRTPQFLAWPYGLGNPKLDLVATQAGFTRTCALRARPSTRVGIGERMLLGDTERFEIPRYTVTARTSLRTFRQMIEGTYRPLR